MSISIGGIDITDALINTEFRVGVLEKVIDRLIRAAPPNTVTDAVVEEIRKDVLKEMQKRYPHAGISPNAGK